MLAVIAVCVLGPLSALYVLGPWAAAALLPGVAAVLGVTLGLGVRPGTFTLPDEIAVIITGVLIVFYFGLLLYMTWWIKLEAYFCYTPWLRHNGKMQAPKCERKYATRCPFTGFRPTMKCPSCCVRVHDSAFHKTDRLVMFPVGETVLRWDIAKAATEMVTGDDLNKARRQLDRALDFRGNTLFATMSACCTGCATWQRCFNLLPRLSLSFAFAAMFFAFIPWGYSSFLSGDSQGTSVSPVGSGGAIAMQIIAEVIAVLYAAAALLVQAQALLRANHFLTKYRPLIPSLKPLFNVPAWLVSRFIRAPWEQLQ